VTIRGTGFGTSGVVQFGTVAARASFWTSTSITVKVPVFATEGGKDADHEGDHQAQSAWLTVTPTGAAASNGVLFRLASGGHDGDDDGDDDSHSDAPRHQVHLGGDFD